MAALIFTTSSARRRPDGTWLRGGKADNGVLTVGTGRWAGFDAIAVRTNLTEGPIQDYVVGLE
jgi:hypothetical protein